MRRALTFAVLLLGTIAVIQAQTGELPAFEVVSVKKTTAPYQERSGIVPTPGYFTLEKAPAMLLISYAFRGTFDEITGTPDWARSDYYNVTAPVPAGTLPARIQQMVRRLLEERFHLATHVEQAQREVMSLVRVKTDAVAPALHRVDVDCEAVAASGQPPAPLNRNEAIPVCRAIWDGRSYQSGGLPLNTFTNMLRGMVGKQVVDDTGLEGNYGFTMQFANPAVGVPPSDDYPDLTTALREQLGFKLVPKQATINILVVDRFDRPTEN